MYFCVLCHVPFCVLCVCVCKTIDIQEFYELTLLDDTKSVQQKTAETLQMANKWETGSQGIQEPPIHRSEVITFFFSIQFFLLDEEIESSLTNQ